MLAADDFDRQAYDPAGAYPLVPGAPRLTQARCELLKTVVAVDQSGERRTLSMPHERPLTVFVDEQGRVLGRVRGAREWDSAASAQLVAQAFRRGGTGSPAPRR